MQRCQARAQETLLFNLVKLKSGKVLGTIGNFLKCSIFNNILQVSAVSLLQILQVAVGEEVQHRSARRGHLCNGDKTVCTE